MHTGFFNKLINSFLFLLTKKNCIFIFFLGLEEEEHEFMRKRQLVSTIETRTSPSRSLLQPGPYPGYCTLRNGGLPLQDLSNIPTKPQVVYPNILENYLFSVHALFLTVSVRNIEVNFKQQKFFLLLYYILTGISPTGVYLISHEIFRDCSIY